jgi:hypothetical protein
MWKGEGRCKVFHSSSVYLHFPFQVDVRIKTASQFCLENLYQFSVLLSCLRITWESFTAVVHNLAGLVQGTCLVCEHLAEVSKNFMWGIFQCIFCKERKTKAMPSLLCHPSGSWHKTNKPVTWRKQQTGADNPSGATLDRKRDRGEGNPGISCHSSQIS